MTSDICEGAVEATLTVFASVWEAHLTGEPVVIAVFDNTTFDVVSTLLADISETFEAAFLVYVEKETMH